MVLKDISASNYEIGLNIAHDTVPIYPNAIDGSLYLDTIKIHVNNTIMGVMPAYLYTPASRAFPVTKHIYKFAGTGDYAGNNIYVINTYTGQFYLHDGDWGVE
jgi:hypothetical protein